MHIRLRLFCLLVLSVSLWETASAATVWDESVNGDLSSNANAPAAVSFSLGSNVITGTITSAAPADTRDYVTFTIPAGEALANLRQLQDIDLPGGGAGNRGFHAIIAGSTSFVPDAGNIGNFLGSNHFDAKPSGTDLLPDLAAAITGGMGFTIPLGPGTYTYLIQQTGSQKNGYSLEFDVIAPEPGTGVLAAIALAGLLWMVFAYPGVDERTKVASAIE